MRKDIPFQEWLIEYAEKMNTCHAANSGQFCSTGGGGSSGGGTGASAIPKKVQAKMDEHVSELKRRGKTTVIDGKRKANLSRGTGGSGGFVARIPKSSVTFHSSTEEGIVHAIFKHFRFI